MTSDQTSNTSASLATVIAQSVQARDSNTIATFRAGPQRKLSGFSTSC